MRTSPHNASATARRNNGFSLVELIVYTAILSIVVSTLTMTAVSLLGSFAYARASGDIAETAGVALERMTRELRFAHAVNAGASTLGTHPGVLVLQTSDPSGTPTTLTVSMAGGRIMLSTGGSTPSPLTRNAVTVSELVFTHMSGTETQAVRIDLTLERTVRGALISKSFRTFVVLDGS